MLQPINMISEQDYLEGELTAEVKHEYLAGEVHAMTGASDRHNLIIGNLYAGLRQQLKGSKCQLFTSDMKVRLEHLKDAYYYYPDVMLACDPDDRETYYRTRPCLLIEVMSKSTERVDSREKLFAYTQIPSLKDYLLISQQERKIEHFCNRNGDWRHETTGQGEIQLSCHDLLLSCDQVYEDIDIEPGE